MEIKINNQEIKLKATFRAMLMYENITDTTFQPKGLTEIVTYFYCTILSSVKDLELTYDLFLEWLDEYPENLKLFTEWITGYNKIQETIAKK